MSEDRRDDPIIDLDRRSSEAAPRALRLDILKALGDNTRYAIYLELARSPLPLATADIAYSPIGSSGESSVEPPSATGVSG